MSLCSVLVTLAATSAGPETALDAFRVGEHRCPQEARHCFGLDLHVAIDAAGQPGFPAERFAALLRETPKHFGPLEIAFQVASVTALPPETAVLRTRQSRTALGQRVVARGNVPVFLVTELHDLDAPGQIRGVHWRDPRRKGWSWIILGTATPSSDRTFTHELGHFFDLPHGKDPASLMNKGWRLAPSPDTWSFVPREQAKIRRALARHLAGGKLAPLAVRSTAQP